MPSLAQAASAVQERTQAKATLDAFGSSAAAGGGSGEPSSAMLTRTGALAARPTTWPAVSLTCLAGGVAGYAMAPYLGHPKLAILAAVLGGAASVQQAFVGDRRARRAQIADDVTEALAPLLGLRKPSRHHVRADRWKPAASKEAKARRDEDHDDENHLGHGLSILASRWSGWWIGTPERIKLVYIRGVVNPEHPKWTASLLDTVSRLLGCEYVITRHDTRKGVVRLRRKYRDASLAPRLELEVLRAERLVRSLLGAGARVSPEFDELTTPPEADDPDDPITADPNRADSELDDHLDADGPSRQVVALNVHHQAGTRISTPAQRARIERSLSAMMPGRWRASFQLHRDFVRFELRPTMPTRVPSPVPTDHVTDPLKNYDDVEIPFSVDEDGRTQSWRPAIDPMLMVVGATGTGKTVLLHNIVARFAHWGWPVHIVDGKGVEFLGFREWPNVQTVATFVDEQVALIHSVRRIMDDRYAAIIAGKAQETDFEPVVLILDEFRDFYGNLHSWYSDIRVTGRGGDPAKPAVLEAVKSIARKGRTSRVHLVLGTQRPDADFLSGEMRDNFRARVALGRLSPQGSLMVWDNATAAISLPRIRGRGTTLGPNGNVIEVQTFWTPDPRKVRHGQDADLDILRGLRPKEARHERLVVIPPEPHSAGEGKDDEVRYHNWSGAYFQQSLTDGVGERSTEHLRHNARIIPLKLRPDLATRSLLSPALAQEWLPETTYGQAHAASMLDHDQLDEDAANDIVMVEPDPRAGGYIAIDPTAHRPRTVTANAEPSDSHDGGSFEEADDLDDPGETADAIDPFAGYSDPIDLDVDELGAGYLVLVDETTDHWAALEGDPEEDIDDPDLRRLEWRDDQDDAESLTVDAGTTITARLPLDDDDPIDQWSTNKPPTTTRRATPGARSDPATTSPTTPTTGRPQRLRPGGRRPPNATPPRPQAPNTNQHPAPNNQTTKTDNTSARDHLRLIR